jgi:hypothetical protein
MEKDGGAIRILGIRDKDKIQSKFLERGLKKKEY